MVINIDPRKEVFKCQVAMAHIPISVSLAAKTSFGYKHPQRAVLVRNTKNNHQEAAPRKTAVLEQTSIHEHGSPKTKLKEEENLEPLPDTLVLETLPAQRDGTNTESSTARKRKLKEDKVEESHSAVEIGDCMKLISRNGVGTPELRNAPWSSPMHITNTLGVLNTRESESPTPTTHSLPRTDSSLSSTTEGCVYGTSVSTCEHDSNNVHQVYRDIGSHNHDYVLGAQHANNSSDCSAVQTDNSWSNGEVDNTVCGFEETMKNSHSPKGNDSGVNNSSTSVLKSENPSYPDFKNNEAHRQRTDLKKTLQSSETSEDLSLNGEGEILANSQTLFTKAELNPSVLPGCTMVGKTFYLGNNMHSSQTLKEQDTTMLNNNNNTEVNCTRKEGYKSVNKEKAEIMDVQVDSGIGSLSMSRTQKSRDTSSTAPLVSDCKSMDPKRLSPESEAEQDCDRAMSLPLPKKSSYSSFSQSNLPPKKRRLHYEQDLETDSVKDKSSVPSFQSLPSDLPKMSFPFSSEISPFTSSPSPDQMNNIPVQQSFVPNNVSIGIPAFQNGPGVLSHGPATLSGRTEREMIMNPTVVPAMSIMSGPYITVSPSGQLMYSLPVPMPHVPFNPQLYSHLGFGHQEIPTTVTPNLITPSVMQSLNTGMQGLMTPVNETETRDVVTRTPESSSPCQPMNLSNGSPVIQPSHKTTLSPHPVSNNSSPLTVNSMPTIFEQTSQPQLHNFTDRNSPLSGNTDRTPEKFVGRGIAIQEQPINLTSRTEKHGKNKPRKPKASKGNTPNKPESTSLATTPAYSNNQESTSLATPTVCSNHSSSPSPGVTSPNNHGNHDTNSYGNTIERTSPKPTGSNRTSPKPAGNQRTSPNPTGSNRTSPKPTGSKKEEEERRMVLQPDEDGDIPLHIAVVQNQLCVVERLISIMKIASVSLDYPNHLKQTPLHLAVITKQQDIVKILLEANSSPNIPDRKGQTCCHLAVSNKTVVCLQIIIEHSKIKVDLNAKNYDGLSPLHRAVQTGSKDCVTTLLHHGVDINMVDGKSGKSPLYLAFECNQPQIADLLLAKGADVNIPTYSGSTVLQAANSRGQHLLNHLIGKNGDGKTQSRELQSKLLNKAAKSRKNHPVETPQSNHISAQTQGSHGNRLVTIAPRLNTTDFAQARHGPSDESAVLVQDNATKLPSRVPFPNCQTVRPAMTTVSNGNQGTHAVMMSSPAGFQNMMSSPFRPVNNKGSNEYVAMDMRTVYGNVDKDVVAMEIQH